MELCTVQYQIIQVINGECTSPNSVRLVDSEAVLQESGFSWCIHCRQAARPKSLARHEELPLLRPTVRIHQNSPLRHRDIETSKHRMCERRPAFSAVDACFVCPLKSVDQINTVYSIHVGTRLWMFVGKRMSWHGGESPVRLVCLLAKTDACHMQLKTRSRQRQTCRF